MNRIKFYDACKQVVGNKKNYKGIGTYGEKSVHAILKRYFENSEDFHEQRVGNYIADIISEDGIIEIQTAGFDKLRNKLNEFLKVSRVTVVYPVAVEKRIISVNECGVIVSQRKSPLKGSMYDVFLELYKIKKYIDNKNFRLCIMMIKVEEYRHTSVNNKPSVRKKYVKYDSVPTELVDELYFKNLYDWSRFVPDNLCEEFTSKDFAKSAGIRLPLAQTALNILSYLNVVIRTGKKGNSYLYSVNDSL